MQVSTSITISDKLKIKTAFQAWIVCLSASLFFFYEFIQINMLNSISPGVIKTFSPTATQLGFLSASYFYGNVLCLFPAGLLLDRFNTRKIVITAMSLSVIGTFIFCLSSSIWLAGVGRFISGAAGGSFCFLGTLRLATRWFPPERMALVTGVSVTVAMAGGVIAQTPLILLVQKIDWQNSLLILACLGVLIVGTITFFVQDKPKEKRKLIDIPQSLPQMKFWDSIRSVIANRQNWLCGIYTSLLNLPILVLGALWGNLYLEQAQGLPQTKASIVITMLYLGMILGSPFIGWFSDRIQLRRLPMLLGVLLSLLVILIIMYVQNLSYSTLVILFLVLGFISSAQNISYPTIAESNPNRLTGSAMGFATVIIMGGGAIFQPLFGWLIRLKWNGLTVSDMPVYSKSDLMMAMLILPIAMLFSLFCTYLIKETHCKANVN